MTWIVANIGLTTIASEALTGTTIYAAIAPQTALRSTFGDTWVHTFFDRGVCKLEQPTVPFSQ
jgi:hypothetical protein